MLHLSLALLGPFQLTLENPLAERVESAKVRGLLAFLVVENNRPHSRPALAELLWPGQSGQAASANFRRALANLRTVIGDRAAETPHLHITRTTAQFNGASDATVDVIHFRRLLQTPETDAAWADNLEQALALYRGPFLEGFTLDGCPEFEQWMATVRSELEQLAARALHQLADHYSGQADMARALALYRRCLALQPYNEAVQRGVMLALVAGGQRAEALAHYASYRRQLQDEVGVEPEAQTLELVAELQEGHVVENDAPTILSASLPATGALAGPGPPEQHHFVGRKQELAALHACARKAAQNHGGILLVVGEAGSGKTTLLHEFARQLEGSPQPWLVAIGASAALLGIGDPYQPFVDALRMLAARQAGLQSQFSPSETARLLQEEAPDWVPLASVSGANRTDALAARPAVPSSPAPAGAELNWLRNHVNGPTIAFFDQLTRFLTRLARRAPLLLALDNLHWADADSMALLYHLSQHLNKSHVLIVGAYRPGALVLEQTERAMLVRFALYELRRHPAAALVDLDRADGRRFIDDLLNRTPNRFDESFRSALYQLTEGHALFTVEMLHALTEAGALSQDRVGRLTASDVIDWDALPSRVETLISERIDRLPNGDRRLLEAASIQGDEFSTQIATTVAGMDERLAVERLSGDLTTAHRIVVPSGRPVDALASDLRYRFRHHLFQAYLYHALDEWRRAWLHRAVGSVLEEQYIQEGATSAVTSQALAWHFTQAGEHARAVEHLRAASQGALAAHASMSAVDLLTRALALTPPDDHGARFELLAMRERANALLRDQQARAEDVGELERLAALTQQPPQQLVAVLRRATLAEETTHYWEAITTANAALKLAVAAGDLAAQVEAHLVAGRGHWWRGEISLAQGRYAHALHHAQAMEAPALVGPCLLHLGIAAWSIGDLAGADAAFTELLESATHAEQLLLRGCALMGSGMVACARGEYGRAEALLDAALSLARQLHHPWLEGQVLLNQVALYRLSMRYADCLALYPQLLQHCQAIDDRWTATAAQMEAAMLFVQLGAWEKVREITEPAAATADDLSALLLKLRLLLLQLRLALATGETVAGADVDQALAMAHKLGVASLRAEAWLLSGLVEQREGRLTEAAAALAQAHELARGEASQRLLPEIVGAQAELSLTQGDSERALAYVAELVGDNPPLLIEQAVDPSSLYMTCFAVLSAVGEPWAEQMLVRGRRLLAEQASLIADEELRRSFCQNIAPHRALGSLDR